MPLDAARKQPTKKPKIHKTMNSSSTARRVFIKRTASTALATVIALAVLSSDSLATPTLTSINCPNPTWGVKGMCGRTQVDAQVGDTQHTNPDARAYCDSVNGTASCTLYDDQQCAGPGAKFKAGEKLFCK